MADEKSYDSNWVEHSPRGSRVQGAVYRMTTHPETGEVVYKQLTQSEAQQRDNDKANWENKQRVGKGDSWWPDDAERLKVLEVQLGLRDPKTDAIKYFMTPGGLNGNIINISKL